ncbi:hypothetical protein ACVITL_004709 [Rhizobium pisi]
MTQTAVSSPALNSRAERKRVSTVRLDAVIKLSAPGGEIMRLN